TSRSVATGGRSTWPPHSDSTTSSSPDSGWNGRSTRRSRRKSSAKIGSRACPRSVGCERAISGRCTASRSSGSGAIRRTATPPDPRTAHASCRGAAPCHYATYAPCLDRVRPPRVDSFSELRLGGATMQTMKVFLLMAGLTALLVVIGGWIGGSSGALVFFVFAAVMNFAMYWWSDKVVLRMYRAKTVGPDDAPELYRMVDRLRQ